MARRRRKQDSIKTFEVTVDLMPLMSMFISIIPMLLLSAVFLELGAIKMQLPSGDPNAPLTAVEKESLGLTIYILDDAFAVEGRDLPRQAAARAHDGVEQGLMTMLGQAVAAHPENKEVIIGSGPAVRYQDIIQVMDLARKVGLERVSLLGTGAI
ncbi:MAG TPA: biopolymer transporter ExbD [bacterium]|nr:biopolymer transporter ExbD [bacterium]